MTRKDSERDAERPRYYSQFWLDVAAGRRVIGTPDDLDIPNIVVEEDYTPDTATSSEEEEEPGEDFYDEEEEEEEEEEGSGWSGRGRKKPTPRRQAKQPKKGIKRDQRRGY